jgi:hypothetical protein
VDIADEIELVSFCPDIGLEGNGELFILGVVRAGGDGGDPGTGVYPKGAIAGTGDGSPGGQGIAYGRQEGDGQFVDLLDAVGLFFMGKEEMKFVGNIFLGNAGVTNGAVPGMADGLGDGEGRTFAGLGMDRTGEYRATITIASLTLPQAGTRIGNGTNLCVFLNRRKDRGKLENFCRGGRIIGE